MPGRVPPLTKRPTMSDDEVDPELLTLLRKSLGLGGGAANPHAAETKVLENAQYVFDNAIDVALDPSKTKEAAEKIWRLMQEKGYSTQSWSEHELHPKSKDESTVDFIFTMDLLNFSFWSDESDESKRFAIEYRGRKWTGYWGLVASLQRALDEEIPITSPDYWMDEDRCTDEVLKHVFRSATDEEIPLFKERVECLREAGRILCEDFDGSFTSCIYSANHSAVALVNLLAESFPCFRDETSFHGRRVRLYKRAQILVADLWACFDGQCYGEFHDIDKITMFADYRIPQMLYQLGCLRYSPPLESHIRNLKPIPSGSNWEIELRGASIWCVELIKRTIEQQHPEAKVKRQQKCSGNYNCQNKSCNGNLWKGTSNGTSNGTTSNGTTSNGTTSNGTKSNGTTSNGTTSNGTTSNGTTSNGTTSNGTTNGNGTIKTNGHPSAVKPEPETENLPTSTTTTISGVNAILIDFFLYDTMKTLEMEKLETIPHHRTRSIWY